MVSSVVTFNVLDPQCGPRELLVGEENALVGVAWRAVLESDSKFSPLVITGPTGTGKTCLAEALAAAWLEQSCERSWQRLTGVDFARQYANACDTDSLGDFRQSLSSAGLILVDAVQTLDDKPRAARELCLQLDAWLADGKIVVITSAIPPAELASEALASRLSQGLVVPLSLPAIDTRRAMLLHFARQRGIELPASVVELLVEQAPGAVSRAPSPRDLESVVLQLDARAQLTGAPISTDLVDALLAGEQRPAVRLEQILAAVARREGVTVDELRSSSRRQSLVRARGIAIALARRLTSESFQSIGRLLGNRDHSTVHHAWQTTEAALLADEALQKLTADLEKEITAKVSAREGKRRG